MREAAKHKMEPKMFGARAAFFLEDDARALWRARKAERWGGAGVGARIHKQQAWYGYGETHGLGRRVGGATRRHDKETVPPTKTPRIASKAAFCAIYDGVLLACD